VIAPVRADGKWTLAEDGEKIWPSGFVQLWHHQFTPDARKLAAIAAPKFGRWTVAVDGKPWSVAFKDLVIDLVHSPDSSRIAVLGKNDGQWTICVDGRKWHQDFNMVWKPVFSPDSSHVAAKVEKNGKYGIAIDDTLWNEMFEALWDPVFSPDGDSLLVRAVRDGKYMRQVIAVNELVK
jgi:hypothetical protein